MAQLKSTAMQGSLYLAQWGVLGMRWGYRKMPDGKVKRVGRTKADPKRKEKSDDRKSVDTLRRNPAKTLSNQEIKKVNDRLNMEKQLRQLSKETKVTTKGAKFVKGLAGTAGTVSALYAFSQSPAGKAIVNNAKAAYAKTK